MQRAADRLPTSPLYGMVSRHLVELLTRHADSLGTGPMAAALGESTAHLVRALLVGTEDPGPGVPEVVETLVSQVRVYVHQHLHDPALGPDMVAGDLAVDDDTCSGP